MVQGLLSCAFQVDTTDLRCIRDPMIMMMINFELRPRVLWCELPLTCSLVTMQNSIGLCHTVCELLRFPKTGVAGAPHLKLRDVIDQKRCIFP